MVLVTAGSSRLVQQVLGMVLSTPPAVPHQILTAAQWGGYLLSSTFTCWKTGTDSLDGLPCEITPQPGIILLLCSSLFSFQGGSCANIGLHF